MQSISHQGQEARSTPYSQMFNLCLASAYCRSGFYQQHFFSNFSLVPKLKWHMTGEGYLQNADAVYSVFLQRPDKSSTVQSLRAGSRGKRNSKCIYLNTYCTGHLDQFIRDNDHTQTEGEHVRLTKVLNVYYKKSADTYSHLCLSRSLHPMPKLCTLAARQISCFVVQLSKRQRLCQPQNPQIWQLDEGG